MSELTNFFADQLGDEDMKKSITVRRCEKLAQTLKQLGYRDRISLNDLKYWIGYTIGDDPMTVKRYLERLRKLGYIRPTSAGPVYLLNLKPTVKVPIGQQLIVQLESEEEPP